MQRRYHINGRLAWFQSAPLFNWDQHWAQHLTAEVFSQPSLGIISLFSDVLPREGIILEAGCGMGQHVLGMLNAGYRCEGVDSAAATIAKVQQIKPDLPVRVGDLLALNVPDGYYSAYVSLGVVEHLFEGPGPFLVEAGRVLEPSGVGIFTVPFFNPLRKFKAALGLYRGEPAPTSSFYQYALSSQEMKSLLEKHGFVVEDTRYYALWKGLKDEITPLAWLNRKARIAGTMNPWAERQKWLMPYAAHMVAFVCRKKS